MPISAGAISGQYVLIIPRYLNITNFGTSNAVIGTISATSDAAIRIPAARRDTLVIAKPAHDATSTVSGTATATTYSELSVYQGMSTLSNARG